MISSELWTDETDPNTPDEDLTDAQVEERRRRREFYDTVGVDDADLLTTPDEELTDAQVERKRELEANLPSDGESLTDAIEAIYDSVFGDEDEEDDYGDEDEEEGSGTGGIFGGLRDLANDAADAFRGVADDAVKGAKDEAKGVGKDFGNGAVEGAKETAAEVAEPARDWIDTALDWGLAAGFLVLGAVGGKKLIDHTTKKLKAGTDRMKRKGKRGGRK